MTGGLRLGFAARLLGISILEVAESDAQAAFDAFLNCSGKSARLGAIQACCGCEVDVNNFAHHLPADMLECAEEDVDLSTAYYPNDEKYESQWNLRKIGAERAWNVTMGSPRVAVAVIDTGVDYNHPDLWDNMWVNERETPGNGIDDDGNGYVDDYYGYDFINDDGDPFDDHGHGTHCAGVIGAVGGNGIGVAGVAPRVRLMACKFMDKYGAGVLSDAVKCLDYALQMNASISSNSYGHPQQSRCMAASLQAAERRGHLFVTAAGNEATDNDATPSYPASYSHSSVLTVAATDINDNLTAFSNYGANSVDVAAPGHSVLSTAPGGYNSDSGTSTAAPLVAGSDGCHLVLWDGIPLFILIPVDCVYFRAVCALCVHGFSVFRHTNLQQQLAIGEALLSARTCSQFQSFMIFSYV
ncbi:unnamed protein product [Ostreobium quekettii]|uniref:Peptidase S8/S53 domain-containing protein n=1 Tax=Ostreobium quekettii TaxID=121088 RepID=A0A8S1J3E3_9CHLO|nr:unnamed protein product [Ostreobium quekettii]